MWFMGDDPERWQLIRESFLAAALVGASKGPMQQRDYGAADAGFSCRFTNVDLDNGGSHEVHALGEESEWAVCTLELKVHKEQMSAPTKQ